MENLDKLITIKNSKTGEVRRLTKREAYDLPIEDWHYTTKSVYKRYLKDLALKYDGGKLNQGRDSRAKVRLHNNRKVTKGRRFIYASFTSTIDRVKDNFGKIRKIMKSSYNTIKVDKGYARHNSIIYNEPLSNCGSTLLRKSGKGTVVKQVTTLKAGELVKKRESTYKQRAR